MSSFVKAKRNVLPKPCSEILNKMPYEAFLKELKDQGVCVLSLSNARSWYQEIPENLIGAYLKNRDHRTLGALLHADALAYARAGIRVQ